MSKVIVTFEKNWRGYAAGETAGFDSGVADSLVEAGYAMEGSGDDKKPPRKSVKTASGVPPKSGAVAGSSSVSGDDDSSNNDEKP